MSKTKIIQHKGIIKKISSEGILVHFVSESACAACHAKGVCSAADMKDKEILIPDNTEKYHIGEPVNILISMAQGSRAVLIGYVYPLVVFLFSLLMLTSVGIDELHAGLYSLGVLIPYYLMVFIFRNKIDKGFKFMIRKEDKL